MAELRELIERLEKAMGPDRGIDAALLCLDVPATQPLFPHWTPEQIENIVPRYTASLDATVALVERMRPGWTWWMQTYQDGHAEAQVWQPQGQRFEDFTGWVTSTPAIALLAALLKSLEAEHG